MNTLANYNIKIVEGNAFTLVLPLKSRTYESCQPIDEDIVITDLQNVVAYIGDVEYTPVLNSDGVYLSDGGTLKPGNYNVLLTATYHGVSIRAAYRDAVTIVSYNNYSDAQQYLQGSPIVLPAAYVLGILSDAELEALKEEYREKNAQLEQAIADAEAAKEEFIEKAEQLEDVAKETTSQEIKQLIINEGIEHAHEYAEEIHEIIGDWTI